MLLKVEKLSKSFGSVIAAKEVNFKMKEGEIIGIIGSNGAGKTTFCNMITGYTQPDSGSIYFKEKKINKLGVQEIKNLGIHRSFQIPQVFDNLSVTENVLISNLVADGKQNNFFELAYNKKNIELAKFMVKKFALQKYESAIAKDLPQGDRKVLDILIAILGRPSIILLDEPTSGISSNEKNKVMKNILNAISDLNISILFIEHDMEIIEKFSKRVVAFDNGQILADGLPKEVLQNKKVKENILGSLNA